MRPTDRGTDRPTDQWTDRPTDRLPPLARPTGFDGRPTDRPTAFDASKVLGVLAIVAWLYAAWLFFLACLGPLMVVVLNVLMFKVLASVLAASAASVRRSRSH